MPNARPVQGIRSKDRTFAEGFAPSAEIFYATRVQARSYNFACVRNGRFKDIE